MQSYLDSDSESIICIIIIESDDQRAIRMDGKLGGGVETTKKGHCISLHFFP